VIIIFILLAFLLSFICIHLNGVFNNNNNNNNNNNSFLTTIQNQAIPTRNYMKCILKQPDIDELCRRCGKEPETIQHNSG
jgi:hypothetical protein